MYTCALKHVFLHEPVLNSNSNLIKIFSQKRLGEVGTVCLCAEILLFHHVEKVQSIEFHPIQDSPIFKIFSQKRPGEVGIVCLCANIVVFLMLRKPNLFLCIKTSFPSFLETLLDIALIQRHGSMIPKHKQLDQPKKLQTFIYTYILA